MHVAIRAQTALISRLKTLFKPLESVCVSVPINLFSVAAYLYYSHVTYKKTLTLSYIVVRNYIENNPYSIAEISLFLLF